MDWQPIETAPKDGTRVLLVEAEQPTGVSTGWWTMAGWRDFGDIGCNGLADYSPTHWMQLPAPPRPLEARRASFASHKASSKLGKSKRELASTNKRLILEKRCGKLSLAGYGDML